MAQLPEPQRQLLQRIRHSQAVLDELQQNLELAAKGKRKLSMSQAQAERQVKTWEAQIGRMYQELENLENALGTAASIAGGGAGRRVWAAPRDWDSHANQGSILLIRRQRSGFLFSMAS